MYTYELVSIPRIDEHAKTLAKIKLVYNQIFMSLFPLVKFASQTMTPMDDVFYVRLADSYMREHEEHRKYSSIVQGVCLKLKSVFAGLCGAHDVVQADRYLESEYNSPCLSLPIDYLHGEDIEIAYLGDLSTCGEVPENAQFIEFVPSRFDCSVWYCKAYYEESLTKFGSGLAVISIINGYKDTTLSVTGKSSTFTDKRLNRYCAELKKIAQDLSYALASKFAKSFDFYSDAAKIAKSQRFYGAALEKLAIGYAPEFAKSLISRYSTFGFVAPPANQTTDLFNALCIDILRDELIRVSAFAEVKQKRVRQSVYVFDDLNYCPKCQNGINSSIDGSYIRCKKHGNVERVHAEVQNAFNLIDRKL
jgi:hypothetical protein